MKTICLCMIVKNESNVILKCLDSISKYIEHWVICDTGSTDGTQDIIRNYFKDKKIDGELHETKWKDFGYNRTEAFQKAAASNHKCDYFYVIDADDQLVGDFAKFKNDTNYSDSYDIEFHVGDTKFKRKQCFHSKHTWRYVGVLHEYPTCDNNDIKESTILDCHVLDGRCGSRTTSDENKYLKDVATLLQGIKDEPNNERYYFYLAQSYYDCGDFKNAMKYYHKRVKMGKWVEEVYYSLYRYAVSKYKIEKNMEETEYDFLRAHNYRPSRLEALYELVKYYRIKNPKKGYAYGMLGYEGSQKYPSDVLFVQDDIHRFQFIDELAICAYYANNHSLVLELNDKIIALHDEGVANIDINRIYNNKELSLDALNPKKTVCIYTGYSNINYNGSNYRQQKIGGSEIAAINVAEQLAKYYKVYFCGFNIKEGIYNNVYYDGPKKLYDLLDNNKVDYLIISRYMHFFTEFKNTAKKTFLWLHDIYPLPWIQGGEFNHLGYDLLYNCRKGIEKIVCLSDWHKKKIMHDTKFEDNKFCIIPNALNNDEFESNVKRITNRFIYISEAARSLEDILNIFPKIVEHIPDAELHVYTEIPDSTNKKIQTMSYVTHHGKVPHSDIITELLKSDAWIHIPTQFCETYCTSALEAQRAGCICFATNIGSLGTTVGERGVIFNGGDDMVKIIVDTLKNKTLIKKKRELMKAWAVKQTWEYRGIQWKHFFNDHSKKYIKIVNLERRGNRRIAMKETLKNAGIGEYEFIKACDGKTLKATTEMKHLFKGNDFKNQRGMVGCAMSHYNLWKRLINDPDHEFYLIFEDDLKLCDNFHSKLNSLLIELEGDPKWDIVYLGFREYYMNSKDIEVSNTLIQFASEGNTGGGTYAYIIRKKGAKKLVDIANKEHIKRGLDWFMIGTFDRIVAYKCNPELVSTEVALMTAQDTDIVDTEIRDPWLDS